MRIHEKEQERLRDIVWWVLAGICLMFWVLDKAVDALEYEADRQAAEAACAQFGTCGEDAR